MNSIIPLGQKNTLAEYMILSGADNRPPMLDKDLYDSWKSQIELYMQNREHRIMIFELVKNGPLIWPTIEENKVTRTKKYAELSTAKNIQADYDLKATNIILQCLPAVIYSLMNHHKGSKDLWERVQLLMQGTSLTKKERENSDGTTLLQHLSVFIQQSSASTITENLDTYDSECDDISNANVVLMANISNHGSDVISETLILEDVSRSKMAKKPLDNALDFAWIFKIDLVHLAHKLLQNMEAHIDYLKLTQEQAGILWGIVKQAKAKQPLDNALDFAWIFKIDLVYLAPKLFQNREAHIDCLKLTQEQADILWGIVKQAKAKQPLDNTLDFALVSNPVSQQPCIPPNRDDWDHLFQPMFDEYFNPSSIVDSPVPVAATPRAVDLADSPVSTSIDQDAPSTRSSSNIRETHTLFEHFGRWTKDHRIANVIDDPSRSVSTRKQLQTDAMWCYFDAFLTSVEPKNFKQAMTKPSWIDAMQEEIDEFKRLQV
uniref:Integrase, catalytic region, zinc finger, CCHC-type, peptidase aspartic, catalytic n=1 Tax=Tanacetum cinerariifolium TaxID=118510 RepID=A0A699I0V8_TANCI|nr:integrase, catalytic region, zinc finger, CCHC-type, peptidase aspartic, catalytic [Tanacetum cinerariifolium]